MRKYKGMMISIAVMLAAGSILVSKKTMAADFSAGNSVSGNHPAVADESPEETEEEEGSREKERESAEGQEKEERVMSLQVPRELEVIIDPWEQNGRGQIYSENYQIANSGGNAGTLFLSCYVEKGNGQKQLKFLDDRNRVHEDDEKAVCIEILFDDGTRKNLNEEGSKYETELDAEESISFRFAGEVNENASDNWEDGDIRVTIVCGWEFEEEAEQTDIVETQLNETESEETESITETGSETEEAESTVETESEEFGTKEEPETKTETGTETETGTTDGAETESGQESSSFTEPEDEKESVEETASVKGESDTAEGWETRTGA